MKQKTFEEKFPKLSQYLNENDKFGNIKEVLEKYCLDKQRVREVIDRQLGDLREAQARLCFPFENLEEEKRRPERLKFVENIIGKLKELKKELGI